MARSCIINPCVKGMTVNTCPYNPLLGCDCGANPAWTKDQLDNYISEIENKEQIREEDRATTYSS